MQCTQSVTNLMANTQSNADQILPLVGRFSDHDFVVPGLGLSAF